MNPSIYCTLKCPVLTRLRPFLVLLILFIATSSAAEETTALALVDEGLRLTFERKTDGWQTSCFFEHMQAAKPASDGANCARELMAKPWQLIDAQQQVVDIESLELVEQLGGSSIGVANYKLPPGVELAYDRSQPRYSWMGEIPAPLIAVPRGTRVQKMPSQAAPQPASGIIKRLQQLYLAPGREIVKCTDTAPLARAATADEVSIEPLRRYAGGITFYDVSLIIPPDTDCGIIDSEYELMASLNGKVFELTQPFRSLASVTTMSMSLFDGFRISGAHGTDELFILYVGGYNRDGYALLDSNLNLIAVSMWGYH